MAWGGKNDAAGLVRAEHIQNNADVLGLLGLLLVCWVLKESASPKLSWQSGSFLLFCPNNASD